MRVEVCLFVLSLVRSCSFIIIIMIIHWCEFIKWVKKRCRTLCQGVYVCECDLNCETDWEFDVCTMCMRNGHRLIFRNLWYPTALSSFFLFISSSVLAYSNIKPNDEYRKTACTFYNTTRIAVHDIQILCARSDDGWALVVCISARRLAFGVILIWHSTAFCSALNVRIRWIRSG